ncbi:HERC1, partial [Symbiodinium sp. CCMP2592]
RHGGQQPKPQHRQIPGLGWRRKCRDDGSKLGHQESARSLRDEGGPGAGATRARPTHERLRDAAEGSQSRIESAWVVLVPEGGEGWLGLVRPGAPAHGALSTQEVPQCRGRSIRAGNRLRCLHRGGPNGAPARGSTGRSREAVLRRGPGLWGRSVGWPNAGRRTRKEWLGRHLPAYASEGLHALGRL